MHLMFLGTLHFASWLNCTHMSATSCRFFPQMSTMCIARRPPLLAAPEWTRLQPCPVHAKWRLGFEQTAWNSSPLVKPKAHALRRDTGMRSFHLETCPANIVCRIARVDLVFGALQLSHQELTNSHHSQQGKKRWVRIFHSRLCDGTCLVCQQMLERQLTT